LLMLIDLLLTEPLENAGDAYAQFFEIHSRIQALCDRLTELRDRELFNVWSRHAWELKEELQIIASALVQKKADCHISAGLELENYLPGTFRGGILAKLERFLAMDPQGRIGIRKAQ